MTLDKMPENVVNKNYETETQCTINLHVPANKGDPSKSNISDILLTIFRRRKSQKVKALTVKLSQRSLMLPVLMKLLLKILFCIMLRILGQKNKLQNSLTYSTPTGMAKAARSPAVLQPQ